MDSNNQSWQNSASQPEESPQKPPERWIHPDTLKFMGMAKELLESPSIKQAISDEDPEPPNG